MKHKIAFRWRPFVEGREPDVARVFTYDLGRVALLANAYDDGFATCWPIGSRLILDSFEAGWNKSSGLAPERLANAFEYARECFVTEAPRLPPALADSLSAAATLLAVAVEGAHAYVCWIGGGTCFFVRGNKVMTQTAPHTLAQEFRRLHPDAEVNVPDVLVRCIQDEDRGAPERCEFELQPGDRIVLSSAGSFATWRDAESFADEVFARVPAYAAVIELSATE